MWNTRRDWKRSFVPLTDLDAARVHIGWFRDWSLPDLSSPAPMTPLSQPPAKANLKAWWNKLTSVKPDAEQQRVEEGQHTVFGQPLRESLRYASVQLSTANSKGELYVWGYIPVVVAKCGLYLKENATEVPRIFGENGSIKHMKELQAIFETPPRYGKDLAYHGERWTVHDVASVFRTYLTQMPESVIPHGMYHDFRSALLKLPRDQDVIIATYQRLIRSMPRANQYLLLYVLDLLSVFARHADKNLMTASNLALIFQPGLLAHPIHKKPKEHALSQEVLEFLIAQQDWFMLDIPPPPLPLPQSKTSSANPVTRWEDNVVVLPSSNDNGSQVGDGWKLVQKPEKTLKVPRRRTSMDSISSQVLGKSLRRRPKSADNVISGPLSGNSKVVATQLRTQSSEPQYSMDASREHIINLPSQAAIQQQKMIQQPSEVADEMVDMAGTTDRDLSGMITQKGKDIEHPQLPSDSADDHTEQVVLPSDLRPKLYKNLLSLLFDVLDTQAVPELDPQLSQTRKYIRLSKTLQGVYEPMLKHNDVMSLVQSHDYRVQLLEFSSRLGIREQPRVRLALASDELDIFNILRDVIRSDEDSAVLGLEGNNAETFMNLIQRVLNNHPLWNTEDPDTYRIARQLLVRLSKACDSLPSSLFISGVVRSEEEARYGGGFADIFHAVYNGKEVALKRLRVYQGSRDRQRVHRMFCKEALIWKQLDHPHVLPFLGIDLEIFPGFMCMVSPWMQHGTIMAHLEDNGRDSIDIYRCLYEIARGIDYLHSQLVVHGDIRGANILIDQDWHARLADFGLTAFAEVAASTYTSHFRGAVRWMAPELHQPEIFGLEKFQRTFKTDVFAFAFVCLEVYTSSPPFSDVPNDTAVLFKLMNGARPKRPSALQSGTRPMSDKLWALIESCWSQQIADRPNISEVVDVMKTVMG